MKSTRKLCGVNYFGGQEKKAVGVAAAVVMATFSHRLQIQQAQTEMTQYLASDRNTVNKVINLESHSASPQSLRAYRVGGPCV